MSEWGSGTGKRDNGRNQILQKQIRKGLMGKGSREGESQVSNLGECVNGKGFNYAGSLGLWGHECVWGLVRIEALGVSHCTDV